MNLLPESVQKYLQKYSLGNWTLESNEKNEIDNAIVIPVISEYENLRKLLTSLIKNDNTYFLQTAVIIVVNNFLDSSEEIKLDNQKSRGFLRDVISKNCYEDSLALEIINSNLNICLIDASSEGYEMPDKIGGVGLARKFGMDEALKIFKYNATTKKILVCLDADCTVASNYLTSIVSEFNKRNLSAGFVSFRHNTEEDSPTTAAIICYEIFLHYYVLGLKYADSPFAFHTIGSTMICDHESYIKVEGMNKEKAAEDFYFMEKLAKNYKIEKINSTTVYPSSRSSWRVPFGTGQRVGRFLSNKQNEYLLYDPISFAILKAWLEIFNTNKIKTSAEYLSFAEKIHPELSNFLIEQNFENDWDRILKNSTKPEQLTKQKHKWFDGFKTLKLIHYLRDKSFPQIDMFESLNGLLSRLEIKKDFYWHKKDIPDIETQKQYLELLRELT
jgi:hypothetical protein